MDPQGRILLHSAVRDRAGLHGDVSVLGQQDHLEVWNRAAFEEKLGVEAPDRRGLVGSLGAGNLNGGSVERHPCECRLFPSRIPR